jgi:hypothetical protein
MIFKSGDRVQVTEEVSETKLFSISEQIIHPGASGVVVSPDRYADLCVIHFDRPEGSELPEEDYTYWSIPSNLLKLEEKPEGEGPDFSLRARRNLLAAEYTNVVSYNELGIGLKALIDKLIQTQDILAKVIDNKEENN